jgi:membrane protease YdiL (CAAX protease family)
MPLANIPQIWWYPIIYIPLLVAAFQVKRLLGISNEQIGFTFKSGNIWIQIAVALSGFLLGAVEYFILSAEAESTGLVLGETWLLAMVFLVLCTGLVEEFIFRGVLQHAAVKAFGWWGVIYVSFLFAIVHWIHNSVLDIIFVFAVAAYFGWVVKKTGTLAGVILSHGIANSVLFLLMPVLF